jgi:hypothetical protein
MCERRVEVVCKALIVYVSPEVLRMCRHKYSEFEQSTLMTVVPFTMSATFHQNPTENARGLHGCDGEARQNDTAISFWDFPRANAQSYAKPV